MIKICLKTQLLIFACCVLLTAASSRAQTTLETSEQSNLGGAAQSATFSLVASVGGAPTPGGTASSGRFALASGFVGTLLDEFEVNLAPAISHTAVTTGDAGQDINVTADITDDSGLSEVTLNFREGGASTFTPVSMNSTSGDQFDGTIPGSSVGNRGVEYFIEATDLNGLSVREGVFSIHVTIPDPGIVKNSPQPGGSAQTAYRLVSIPLDADNKNASSVLVDDLGQFDDTEWRFFELRANQSYDEFPTASGMEPGKAFWLIVRQSGRIIDTGPGRTNLTDQEFAINLNAGWNFVGNPFNFPIPVSSHVFMESGADLDIRSFSGTQFSAFTGSMQPFDGYAVFSETSDRLMIDPVLSPVSAEVRKHSDLLRSEPLWSIAIAAQIQQARDTQNFAAVLPDAAMTWDRHDRPEAPAIGEYVSVSFPHPEWGRVSPTYATDARPEPQNGDTWEFEVVSNIRDRINLSFRDLERVPDDFQIWLVDEKLKVVQDLKKRNTYHYFNVGEHTPKTLKLIVGKQNFIGESREIAAGIPRGFELAQNFPNPFNPSTTIRYGLPTASRVTLKVYNLRGETVATLVSDEPRDAGYHLAFWNGRNDSGQPVASGVYVYKLVAGHTNLSKKLALLK